MDYDAVVNGIVAYINKEILPAMTDWQEMLARVAMSRMLQSKDTYKTALVNNTFLQTFGFVSADGKVDVDGIASSLKEQIAEKGKIEVSLPVFGKLWFTPDDVDKLYRYITGG